MLSTVFSGIYKFGDVYIARNLIYLVKIDALFIRENAYKHNFSISSEVKLLDSKQLRYKQTFKILELDTPIHICICM